MCFISSLGFTCRNKDLRGSLSKNHMETTRLCPPKRDECTHHMHGSSFVEWRYHSSNLVRELYLVSLAGRSSLHSPLISNFPSSRQFGKPQNSTKKSLFQIGTLKHTLFLSPAFRCRSSQIWQIEISPSEYWAFVRQSYACSAGKGKIFIRTQFWI